jgi:hypothetical protein
MHSFSQIVDGHVGPLIITKLLQIKGKGKMRKKFNFTTEMEVKCKWNSTTNGFPILS